MNTQPQTIEDRIEARIDQSTARDLAVSQQTGALTFTNARDAMEGAKMLAVGNFAIPKQFRGNPGACFAMIMQAAEWNMSPLQVINKSYVVNDRVAFESQLVQAVILRRAPLKDGVNAHFNIEFKGEGEQRTCRVSVALRNGDVVDCTSPPRSQITPQNSPLWKSDPDQQLFYYSARALCRRHFPHVLLGIYAKDELEDQPAIGPDRARDVTPPKTIAEKLDALTKAQDAVPDPADDYSAPVPQFVSDEFAGYIPPEPPATFLPDMFEPIRERARADAEKRIRRMAPTALSAEEKEVYLQAFDAHRAAESAEMAGAIIERVEAVLDLSVADITTWEIERTALAIVAAVTPLIRAAALEEAGGWQPIENAPANTKVLLGLWLSSYRWFEIVAEKVSAEGFSWIADSGRITLKPTHWHPLPLPPARSAP